MKFMHLIPALLCLLVALSPASAQETESSGWPVEERCVGEPTEPPDGWTFPGAILMTGHYGIHAVSADVETPYVAVFLGRRDVPGGALSPDGLWYASPIGSAGNDIFYTGTYSVSVDAVRLYSTHSEEAHTIEIPGVVFVNENGQIQWHDNEHFVYPTNDETLLIHSITGEYSSLEGLADFFKTYHGSMNITVSPDWTRAVYQSGGRLEARWQLLDFEDASFLRELALAQDSPVGWQADSSGFAAELRDKQDRENPQTSVAILDTSGEVEQTIFLLPNNAHLRNSFDLRVHNIRWSPNGRYLAFITTTLNYPTVISLYIADMQERRVLNTCIETSDGLAWSPDGTKLAMMDFYDFKRHRPVMVLDLESWALYTVAYHDGSIIGWRGD
jgi:hypothetical protein